LKKFAVIICLAVILFAGPAKAADERKIGFVKSTSGRAYIYRQKFMFPAQMSDVLMEKDTLITKGGGSMGVVLQDNSVLSLGPNSRVDLSRFRFDPSVDKAEFTTKVRKGTMVYMTGIIAKINRKGLRIETPNVVCGVRGTRIAIRVDSNEDEEIEPVKLEDKPKLLQTLDKLQGIREE